MFRALSTAATGMNVQQTKIDAISNNLANVNTPGFKRTRTEFQDLIYQTMLVPGTKSSQNVENPSGMQIGLGSRAVSTQKMFAMGDIRITGHEYDVAIEGDGFLAVQQPSGEVGYTRAGNLRVNSSGQLVTADGFLLNPQITIPQDATEITIARDGTVSAKIANQATVIDLGQLQTALFVNPAGLLAIGQNLYTPTPASGQAILGRPGEGGRGSLAQGSLEYSNVKVVDEMIDLIMAQRAYDINSRAIQAADDMMKKATDMR